MVDCSDDLFDDEEESADSSKSTKSGKEEGGSTRKYLDEKWELNKEDSKEFKGFTKEIKPLTGNVDDICSFALMYKFRREYLDTSMDAVMGEHNGYCLKFKRLLSSELIDLGKAKGVVLLWAGFTAGDRDETKEEITSFLEEDPLIAKDIVENWDLIELSKQGESVDVPQLPSLKIKGSA